MTRLITLPVALGIAATTLVLAQAPRSIEAQFKTAQHAEEVEGDLKKAIEQYRQIAERGDRSTAVRALLRLAECHQKLGNAEAKNVYERIVRDFSDQKAAVVVARARLESRARPAPAGLTTQRVMESGGAWDSVSPDGRFVAGPDHKTGNLVLHELKTGRVRPLTSDGHGEDPGHQFPLASAFSRDGRQIAYEWYVEDKDQSILRVIGINDAPTKNPRTLYDHPDTDLTPADWSPDGQWISVTITREDNVRQIGVVRVSDGTLRVLKTVDWSRVGGLRFSPDSSRLAYHRPPREDSVDRDVFVIAVDGSRETAIAASPGDDVVLEWTPDGERVLIASDRSGSNSVWSIPASGEAPTSIELVKSDIGIISSLKLTRDGALFYSMLPARQRIYTATYDRATGQLAPGSVQPVQQYKGFASYPQFLDDGTSLGYLSQTDLSAVSGRNLMLLSTDTGRVQEARPALAYGNFAHWFPDGRHVLLYGQDLKGRPGIFKVDAATGQIVLTVPRETCNLPFLASDGHSMFCHSAEQKVLRQLDASFGTVLRTVPIEDQPYAVSPDGQYVVTSSLKIVRLDSGESRAIMRLSPPASQVGNSFTLSWTPDSRSVVFYGRVDGDEGMWRVPIDGGAPQKIVVNVRNIVSWRFNAKTGRVAFSTNGIGPRIEMWKMDNFLLVSATK